MPEGPDQRVMAAPEASSACSFHSESGFCFWGQGAGQGSPHPDGQLADFGEELPWARAASLLSFPASQQRDNILLPWKFPAKAIDVLGMSHGEEAWGGGIVC